MALLMIIAIATMSLSVVETRSSNTKKDNILAKSNARMALMIAIGELQKMAGSDTRVTAPADALASSNGPQQLTGVWRSWEGNNHNKSTGLPVQPDYAAKAQDYTSGSDGRFLGWLISGDGADADATSPPDLMEGTNTVPLLAEGSLGTVTEGEVHLIPTDINETGAYAWWIQGQNSKALIKQPDSDPTGDEEWSQRLASNGLADASSFDFDNPDELGKAVSLRTLDLASNTNAAETASQKYHHAITSYSRGLLTNTATGGWRRDLSLMAEKWNEGTLPTTGLPVFSAEPYAEEMESSLRLSNNASDASIYPWVSVDNVAMSWHALMDFVSLYKKVQKNSTSGEPYFNSVATNDSDWISIQPVMARAHFAFGYDATVKNDVYTPRFLFKPAVTMWNPYNVAIESAPANLLHVYNSTFPFNLYVNVGDQPRALVNIQDLIETSGKSPMMRMVVSPNQGDDNTFKPGESRLYGREGEGESGIQVIYLDPGLRIDGSFVRALSTGASVSDGVATDKFTYDWEHKINNGNVFADLQYFWSRTQNTPDGADLNSKSVRYRMNTPADTIEEKLPLPSLVNDNQTLKSAQEEDSPFLVVSVGLRTILNEDTSEQLSKIHTKGYINTNPIITGTNIAAGVSAEESPYTWEIFAPNSWEDPFIPQSDDSAAFGNDHSGYVGSSFQSGLGLNRWTIAELPTQPLLSLGELQHFDVRFRNQHAPRVSNAIGNSHASPHIARNKINDSSNTFSYDHSYVSNHVFFDDWFISSITPDVEAFTQIENRTIEEVYADHLSRKTPLRNQRYLPAKPVSDTQATTAATDTLSNTEIWHDIASEIEVEGMFNINSTSVDAWTALLMNQREVQVPYSSVGAASADDWSTKLQTSSETVISRTTVAGDPLSSSDSEKARLATYSTMTDSQIKALATEIVKQVKARGPFLSLSEFVNRQLSTDDNLAMAGAIETALMKLAELPTDNPFAEIQAAFPQQATLPSDAASIYEYPKAAEGYAAYGTPGWPRQADILRPIAPILTARDDTFVIRAYGEVKDLSGKVTAKSWCEAVVQRKADYVDPLDESTEFADLQSDLNKEYGRKFVVVSFRWLSEDEI
ncbi:MAG: hypothetical protein ACSHX6_00120 [Akkermansiaceae bacterium]